MRSIKTFQDVEVVLRQQEDRLNRLVVPGVVDWKKRRIVNASPSIDLYDYVVRKELIEATEPKQIVQQGTSTATTRHATFVIEGTATVGTNQGQPLTIPSGWGGRPFEMVGIIEQPPQGDDLVLDFMMNGISIFLPTENMIIPAGETDVVVQTRFENVLFPEHGVFTWTILQVGSTFPGYDASFVLSWI